MIPLNELEALSKNGGIVKKIQSGEITSTEVDLTGLPKEDRLYYQGLADKVNQQWACPQYSGFDSDWQYSQKQGGRFRTNFRLTKSRTEQQEKLDNALSEQVKRHTKKRWHTHLLSIIVDNAIYQAMVAVAVIFLLWFGIDTEWLK
ncbi:hypothetical protein [Vibrio parahaemolyticus]|uniref:hypothetical protein n=1 Tax=Vibrio parahaemolyticus TaxID=670 RepID=UPI001121E02C|nr:hypothetical protein [Vibrio parahaemolyticus]EHH1099119.1 hypothetical protein [Vibrio parahaemolyticus]TOH45883.1 hypothetical protein CGI81_15225 [Vibrio parahaemolyticus]TOI67515.1 hypothetical protein CGI56_07610 [Vibrio parahaemolyticus]HCE3460699.1 hypothetical protein [Vibrio parahaemolyticus]HCM1568052.1 hypothetical protein [Vibrio parahaemolyticus]